MGTLIKESNKSVLLTIQGSHFVECKITIQTWMLCANTKNHVIFTSDFSKFK